MSNDLHNEAVVVKMASALKCCGRLSDAFSRTACYVSFGIRRADLKCPLATADLRAWRYELIRRRIYGGDTDDDASVDLPS